MTIRAVWRTADRLSLALDWLHNRSMEALDDQLRAALLKGPPLRLAILFGSASRGRLAPHSDVDIGIIPARADLPLSLELELQATLARSCRRTVDLVRLDHADTLVRWEVARTGRLLLSVPAYEHAHFVARAASDYADFAPALQRAAARFRRRLAEPAGAATPMAGDDQ